MSAKPEGIQLYFVHVGCDGGGHVYYVEAFDPVSALRLASDKLDGWAQHGIKVKSLGSILAREVSPEETARREVEELLK